MDVEIFALILAGGSGTRFWPKSRLKQPKQLSRLGGASDTMIELTLKRLDSLVPPDRRMIVTHQDQYAETKRIVGDLCATVIPEPEARNTANAVLLAALEVKQQVKGKEAILISLHADTLVQDEARFRANLKAAIDTAKKGYLTLIGTKPTSPETGFGYIELGASIAPNVHMVKSFKEKPNLETAKQYLKSGQYLWNSGMFSFPVSLLIDEFKNYLPENVSLLEKANLSDVASIYSKLTKVSIDEGILERSKNVAVVVADFEWKDVGSWDVLGDVFGKDSAGNYKSGDIVAIDTKNCVIETDGPIIATLGVEDLVIVHDKGAILVCPKSRAQDVKLIVEELKKRNKNQFV